ncbi:MAG: hypothetical protein ACLFVC_03790 [Opitutales bacterium]
MNFLPDAPCLEFNSSFGTFSIRPLRSNLNLFALCIEEDGAPRRELGRYCGINDAVLAVSRQQSGHIPWDQTPSRDLPFRVHDIACWKISENFSTSQGTNPRKRESMAS